MIDSLILTCWENGSAPIIYDAIQYLSLVSQILFILLYGKAYGFSLRRSALIAVITYPILFFSMYFITWVENGFRGWGDNNIVRIYMWAPLLMLMFSKLFKAPYGKMCDYFAPSFALSHAIGHLACPFVGCCHGYPSRWGVYNPALHERQYPIQWIESLGALLLCLYLLFYARRKGYECRGKVLALFLILYGSTRFIFEYFRDNTKLFWGISELAIWAFFAFVTGCVMMIFINRHEKKQHMQDA